MNDSDNRSFLNDEIPLPEAETPVQEAGNEPQPEELTPDSPAECAAQDADRPQSTGRVPQTTGRAPQTTGRVPQMTGRVPQTAGRAHRTTGRVPQSTGRAPQTTGRVPQSTGRVPQTTGRVPQTTGRVPQTTGRVPQTTGRVPRPAGRGGQPRTGREEALQRPGVSGPAGRPGLPPRRGVPRRPEARRRAGLSGRKLHRAAFALAVFFLVGAILATGFSVYLKRHYSIDILTPDMAAGKHADFILVLGCGVRPDGSPTPMLKDRMQMGIDMYIRHAGDKLLLSGDGRNPELGEVAAMHRLAAEAGIPEDEQVLDPEGLNTWASLKRARDVYGAKSVVIISQEYHLYRALYMADKLGLKACGVAAAGQDYSGQFLRDIREVLARVKAVFYVVFD